MKVVQKGKKIIYRWRCLECGSLLEEDESEILKSHGRVNKMTALRHSCPVCGKQTEAVDLHRIAIMDDKKETEIQMW